MLTGSTWASTPRSSSTLLRWLLRARYGSRMRWEGTDIFHFDDQNRIIAKYTYASFRRPIMHKEDSAR